MMKKKKDSKVVIILGAGFSAGTDLPIQSQLLKEVEKHFSKRKTGSWSRFNKFFREILGKDIAAFPIEDIFTILDKCLIDYEQFHGRSIEEIESANQDILHSLRNFLITRTSEVFKKQKNKFKKYSELANGLLAIRKKFKKKDKISIISLNWDNYFEKMLLSKRTNFKKLGLDYCTYDYSFGNNRWIPSILRKAKGQLNLKILKPHGSINWGYCNNCGRLYITFGEARLQKFQCIKYCNKIFRRGIHLTPLMITPTFLKEISNRSLIDIWNNAGIELSEASRIIFIGYSLRPEDFHFRFLLLKHVSPKAEVYVFDHVDQNNVSKKEIEREFYNRYRNFFQKNKTLKLSIAGWENEIEKILGLLE
ncbi:hypothetical protein EHQ53_08085 [Leptospira langatensis]|uniref:Uncharacterized protein n=1 Tax=Leptospira langatensis TaxID=2484983 RepID=A0A5F1ZUN5_9LEPT|nr:hypothetical protein [Leptospira langatensis]TGK01406.1 hypothetical protein EHO57_10785 [Leptospira langatensis]TGL42144.1 hypothetical protein EHQ53_08085 [Leptospira langatensis]